MEPQGDGNQEYNAPIGKKYVGCRRSGNRRSGATLNVSPVGRGRYVGPNHTLPHPFGLNSD